VACYVLLYVAGVGAAFWLGWRRGLTWRQRTHLKRIRRYAAQEAVYLCLNCGKAVARSQMHGGNKMNTCGTCRHWEPEGERGYGACGRIPHDTGGYMCEEGKEQAVTKDGSGYYAALLSRDTFGCNQWETSTISDEHSEFKAPIDYRLVMTAMAVEILASVVSDIVHSDSIVDNCNAGPNQTMIHEDAINTARKLLAKVKGDDDDN